MHASGFPNSHRDSAAHPSNLRLSNESRATHAEEAGSNCNLARQMSCGGLGASALGSALTWLHEPGCGDPGGLELWAAGQRRSETLDGVALEDASGQCASEVVDGPGPAHAAILWPLDLAWKVPEPV